MQLQVLNMARRSIMITRLARPLGLIAFWLFASTASGAIADSAGVSFSEGRNFTEKTGEALYTNVCQACHMDRGQGATGAGRYPALAGNTNLKAGGYPVYVVVHGQKGMPPIGKTMTDDQVAAVVNFVRTHFGNDYHDAVTAQDVKDSR